MSLARLPVAALVAMVAMAAAAAAQVPGSFDERVEVRLVNVEVWVSDRDRQPVAGLTREDFELFHDDQPVPITHFAEVREGARAPQARSSLPADAPTGPAAVLPSHLVVYIDQLRLSPGSYKAVFDGLRRFLDAGSVPAQRVLLLRQDRNLFVAAPFGSSSEDLAAALDRLSKLEPSGVDMSTQMQLAMDAVATAWQQSEDIAGAAAQGIASITGIPSQAASAASPRAGFGGGGTPVGPDTCDMFLSRIEPIVDGWVRARIDRISISLAHLSETASFLSALPGVTAMLYLSDGLETQPGLGLTNYVGSLCPTGQTSLLTSTQSEELSRALLDLTRHLNTNRVTVHSLQASGLQSASLGSASRGSTPGGAGRVRGASAFESSQRGAERDGLTMLAAQTGGRAVFNQNDFGPALGRIGQDMVNYYALAYEPPPESPGSGHRIDVRLRHGSYDLRHRQGYRETDAGEQLSERLEGALNLGLVSNPLAARLGAGKIRARVEGGFTLPLHVIVPVEEITFVPIAESRAAQLKVRVVARNQRSLKVVVEEKRFLVKLAVAADGDQETVGLPVDLELAEGVHLLAVAVQDEATHRASFVTTTLQIGG